MRVISQNGEFDFPYEQIVVQRNENIVFARLVADSKVRNTLGEYETPEKAEKAMEMLIGAYKEDLSRYFFKKRFIEDVVCSYQGESNRGGYFRFPLDSEVEV